MTLGTLKTRLAEPGDLNTVTALFLATLEHYWGSRADTAADARRSAEALLGGEADCRLLIGERDGRAIAYATFAIVYPSPGDRGTLFMKDLFVLADRRGGGTGEAMMRAVARIAAERGCARFDWTAETDNPRALAFYDRIAARRVTEKVYYRFAHDDLARFAGGETEGAD